MSSVFNLMHYITKITQQKLKHKKPPYENVYLHLQIHSTKTENHSVAFTVAV